MDINTEQLRNDLLDYFGTAAYSGFPAAIIDAVDIQYASVNELIQIAQENGFDLRKYQM